MDLPENLRPIQPGWRKKGIMKQGESARDKDGKTGNSSVESHTPPGLLRGLSFVGQLFEQRADAAANEGADVVIMD